LVKCQGSEGGIDYKGGGGQMSIERITKKPTRSGEWKSPKKRGKGPKPVPDPKTLGKKQGRGKG